MTTRLSDKIPQYQYIAAQVGIRPAEFWEMTPGELTTWMDGYREQEKTLDRRTAQVCQAIFENNRNRKSRPKPYTVEEFMPKRKGKTDEAQTPEQMLAVLQGMFGIQIEAGGDNGN